MAGRVGGVGGRGQEEWCRGRTRWVGCSTRVKGRTYAAGRVPRCAGGSPWPPGAAAACAPAPHAHTGAGPGRVRPTTHQALLAQASTPSPWPQACTLLCTRTLTPPHQARVHAAHTPIHIHTGMRTGAGRMHPTTHQARVHAAQAVVGLEQQQQRAGDARQHVADVWGAGGGRCRSQVEEARGWVEGAAAARQQALS